MLTVINGDILYPKSDVLVCPCNLCGILNKNYSAKIVQSGGNLYKNIKKNINNNNFKIGDCFITEAYQFKRRSVKRVYNIILSKYPNDFIQIKNMTLCLDNVLKKALKNNIESIAIPPLGIENLEYNFIAINMLKICKNYKKVMNIKIISDDPKFINVMEKYTIVEENNRIRKSEKNIK